MNITKDIIADLIPLYLSDDCSDDTKRAVTEYIAGHPEFAEQIRKITAHSLTSDLPVPLTPNEEMKTLQRTQSLLQRQKYLMGFAIFFSLAPFSFLYTNGSMYWFFSEAPVSAMIYGGIGAVLWTAYFNSRRPVNK